MGIFASGTHFAISVDVAVAVGCIWQISAKMPVCIYAHTTSWLFEQYLEYGR